MSDLILAFDSERQDPVSGTFPMGNGYRSYHPVLMRFTCPDSWSPFRTGGINFYAFCEGDPVNRADPTGHLSWQAGLGIGLGILGMLGAVFTGGASVAAAGSISAALAGTSAFALVEGTAALVADVTGIASAASEERHPEASVVLGWVSLAAGILSLGAGIGGRLNKATRGIGQRPGNIRARGLGGAERSGNVSAASASPSGSDRSWESIKRYIASEDNFLHRIEETDMEHYQMKSYDLNSPEGNSFVNKFKENKWVFQGNNRKDRNVPYFASDIARYQYETISTRHGFAGVFPERIIREGVTNAETLQMTQGKSGHALFTAFFETPNGKSTKRILDQFGLEAKSVISRPNKYWDDTLDFIIHL